jgi:beta-lactam-binding protein with PASTA domain
VRSFFRFALLALLLVLVALVSALTAMRFAIHGEEVAVPGLVGLAPADAERAAASLGLQLAIERQYYSATIAEGRITSQLPAPGTKVRRGWQVRVAQSLGPQRVAIPDVAGESERAAEFNIRRRGLDVASSAEMQMPGAVAGQVLAQNPPANASQVAAPKISLLVTGAAEPEAYVMPSFLGQPLGIAARTLQDSGFRLGNVTVEASPAASPLATANPAGVGSGTNSAAPSAASNSGAAASPTSSQTSPYAYPGRSTAPAQPSPASIIVSQNPPAGQKVVAGAAVNFEVR